MKRILVCLDFSELSKNVVKEAADFSAKTGATINLCYVSPHRGHKSSHVVENQTQEKSLLLTKESRKMAEYENLARESGAVDVESSFLSGSVVEAICEKAEEYKPNFIIIGSQTTNAAVHMIKGSVGAGLLKKLKLPLLLVP